VARRALLDGLLIAAAAVLFGAAMTWPLAYSAATGSRPAAGSVPGGGVPGGGVAAGEAPPAWLLPLDDAYIFVRYAQQLARGRPLEWTDGEPSTGASSALFPLLLVPGQWLAGSITGWSWWSRGVGAAGLALLGLAAAGWLRRVPLPDPWPAVGGLALVASGPIGLVSIAGMESAWNAAALVWTCALWPGLAARRREPATRTWLVLVAALPLLRPENAALTGLAAIAILAGRAAAPRRAAVFVLAPGLAMAAVDRLLTGMAAPAGAVAKSWTATPFVDLPGLWHLWSAGFARSIVAAYGGLEPPVLWPPVGWLAVGVAAVALGGQVSARVLRLPRLLTGTALVWAVLVLLAPLSSHLSWQWMRHHHSGLALAWLLALGGLALAVDRWVPRLRVLAWSIPILLLLALPRWASEYSRLAWQLASRHAAAAAWLARQGEGEVLLLNDAGWLSLAHDGPAIDSMGLGTPSLAHPDRHGPGSLAEALARYRLRPELAAVNPGPFALTALLGERLLPAREGATILARARGELLDGTALDGPGLDFGYLSDEERWRARWRPSLLWHQPRSVALVLPGGDGPDAAPALQGCRPLPGAVVVAMGGRALGIVATSLAEPAARLTVRGGSRRAATGDVLAAASLAAGRWTTLEVPAVDADAVWIEAGPGSVPCLESIRLVPGG
jgi:hypothetical protein